MLGYKFTTVTHSKCWDISLPQLIHDTGKLISQHLPFFHVDQHLPFFHVDQHLPFFHVDSRMKTYLQNSGTAELWHDTEGTYITILISF